MNDTFRSTWFIRVSKVTWFAYASRSVISWYFTLCVRTTGSRVTWVYGRGYGLNYAWCKWIARVPFFTRTHRAMKTYNTDCIDSTRSWTRIFAFVVDARFFHRTIIVCCTFSITQWWGTLKRWLACACIASGASSECTNAVWSTWRRHTRIRWGDFRWNH